MHDHLWLAFLWGFYTTDYGKIERAQRRTLRAIFFRAKYENVDPNFDSSSEKTVS